MEGVIGHPKEYPEHCQEELADYEAQHGKPFNPMFSYYGNTDSLKPLKVSATHYNGGDVRDVTNLGDTGVDYTFNRVFVDSFTIRETDLIYEWMCDRMANIDHSLARSQAIIKLQEDANFMRFYGSLNRAGDPYCQAKTEKLAAPLDLGKYDGIAIEVRSDKS